MDDKWVQQQKSAILDPLNKYTFVDNRENDISPLLIEMFNHAKHSIVVACWMFEYNASSTYRSPPEFDYLEHLNKLGKRCNVTVYGSSIGLSHMSQNRFKFNEDADIRKYYKHIHFVTYDDVNYLFWTYHTKFFAIDSVGVFTGMNLYHRSYASHNPCKFDSLLFVNDAEVTHKMIKLLEAPDKYKTFKQRHLMDGLKQYLLHSTSIHSQGGEYNGKGCHKYLYNDRLIYDKPFQRNIGATINLMITQAKKYIYICASDSFEPNDILTKNLLDAAKRGVNVHIAYTPYLYNSNIHSLYTHSAQLYCCLKNYPHSKIVVVDNDVLYGSMNLTDRSLYMDYENAIYIKNNPTLCYAIISFIQKLFTSAYSSPYKQVFDRGFLTSGRGDPVPLLLRVSLTFPLKSLLQLPFITDIPSLR